MTLVATLERMPSPLTSRQRRVRWLSTLLLAAALAMPAAVTAQSDDPNGATTTDDVARQIEGSSRQKRVAGPKASCRTFKNGVTFKRGGQPGKGVVKRDFGAGNGDKGELVFTDAPTGTGLFWTDDAGYLSVYVATLVGDLDEAELVGLLFEGAPGSMARGALLDQLVDGAATAGATGEQLLDTLDDVARAVDGGCLWSSRFVPRKRDRGQLVPLWEAMVGEPGSEPLLLEGGRFGVEVAWRDISGDEQTAAQSFDAITSDDDADGYFFDVDGTELLVRLLDGCSSNDHFWVFAAGATDVEFELTVTDTLSDQTKTYTNPLAAVPAITDSSAFATCP